jgi:hypothetical protein
LLACGRSIESKAPVRRNAREPFARPPRGAFSVGPRRTLVLGGSLAIFRSRRGRRRAAYTARASPRWAGYQPVGSAFGGINRGERIRNSAFRAIPFDEAVLSDWSDNRLLPGRQNGGRPRSAEGTLGRPPKLVTATLPPLESHSTRGLEPWVIGNGGRTCSLVTKRAAVLLPTLTVVSSVSYITWV